MPSVTWDAGFEAAPADTDEAKYGAGKIRQLKLAISERLELEMNFKTGTQPLAKAGAIAVCYQGTTVQIGALMEMTAGSFAWDTDLKVFKRYNGATWDILAVIPGGATTKMLFYNDTAPVGWTIVASLDDKLVYITKGSGAGGETGGAVHSTGSWTLSGGNVGSHTLTEAEIPSHAHSYTIISAPGGLGGGATAGGNAATTGYTGGGGGHVHPVSNDGTWRPAAYNCIICSKN